MSTILKYNCVQHTQHTQHTQFQHPTRISRWRDYKYKHTSLYQIYRNFGIDGLTRPLLHPNLFHFHTKSVDKTLLNPLIVEILKSGLLEGGFDDYNFNQMIEFFDDCDAKIYALGSQVTCDNCHIGLGPYWEIKSTRTCLRAVCNNCYNNNDLVNARSDYQADYCTECGEECGSDLCKYCDNRCNDCGVECGPGGCPRCRDEYDDVGCGVCGVDCGADLCKYCRGDDY